MSETPVAPTPEPVPSAPVAAAPATRDSNKALIAIGGIAAAGLVILAGVGGYAVGQYNGSHRDSDVAIARADGPMNNGPMLDGPKNNGPQNNGPQNNGPMMGDQQRPGMPGEMNGRNGQGPRGIDPDGDNWPGGNRMGGHDDGEGHDGYGDDGEGHEGYGDDGYGDDEGQGNGMQGFGQGRGMQGFAPNLQNLPPQVQELLKQFLQGQGGPQGRLQLPTNPGNQS